MRVYYFRIRIIRPLRSEHNNCAMICPIPSKSLNGASRKARTMMRLIIKELNRKGVWVVQVKKEYISDRYTIIAV